MPRRKQVFTLGCLGFLTVFAVFYLRHATAVVDHFAKHGILGAGATLLCLALFAAVGGIWALFHAPLARKTAFSVGLGLAGLLLAVDLSLGDWNPSPSLSVAGVSEGRIQALVESVQLVLSPVRAVRG